MKYYGTGATAIFNSFMKPCMINYLVTTLTSLITAKPILSLLKYVLNLPKLFVCGSGSVEISQ